ncbi:DoxX family protein [Brevibacillus dissolubilis]|uniref:DoxX family protein n=1 Tax=Brevibacillus dissolubilis TaxID=1844116 RepID=UPI00159B8F23|nr:DoxX family protein [Brevibacillus dissolubilis]
MMNWLRNNVYAAGLLFLLRIYLGWEWFHHGIDKLRGTFDATGFLNGAIAKPVLDKATNELIYPNFVAFLEQFALPNAKLFNFLIPLGETLVGLGLMLGALTTAAAFFGLLMNFMFLFAGTVSTNPWFILIGGIILVAGTNAGRFGVDYYLMPLLTKLFHRNNPDGQKGAGLKNTHTPAHM